VLLVSVQGQAENRLNGRVSNHVNVPVTGAKITLERAGTDQRWHAVTDPSGAFSLVLPDPGNYKVSAEREGYFRLEGHPVSVTAGTSEIQLELVPLQELIETMEVSASPPGIDPDTTALQQKLSGTQILNIPYPSTNSLQNALRVMPGVTQDARGNLHVNGGAADQVYYTLDGFNVSDPLTGRFQTRISIEAVQSVEILSGRYSAEYGKGSAGTMAVSTRTGGDEFRYAATNFVPGVEHRKGLLIGNWTPRLHVSGPIQRGRAWFANSLDTQYDKHVVRELPKGEDRVSSWRFSNLLHGQVNLSSANILQAGFLTNWWNAPRTGLSALDPIETTVDRRARQWFFHVKDQIYMRRGAILEIGAAANRTFDREIPQGHEIYEFRPEGKRGNYYVDGLRNAGREQIIVNYFAPSLKLTGDHLIKTGADLNRVTYSQDVRRTGYTHYRLDYTPLRHTEFAGSGALARSNREIGAFVQDSWKPRPGLLLELGLRADWDRLIGTTDFSPRFGFAWSPAENTKVSGGYASIYDATNLNIFTRPQDQYSMTSYFDSFGQVVRGPALSVFIIRPQELSRPRYRNISFGVERMLPGNVFARTQFLRRRGSRGFAYFNILGSRTSSNVPFLESYNTARFDGVYDLANRRQDEYDSVELTVRQPLRGQYEWFASYTYSRARSNAAIDVNVETPTLSADYSGPMAWDTPHRLLSWGYLPTPWKNWSWAYLAEWRNGFPFSIVREDGNILGGLNSLRFPAYFELNLHLERRFRFRGQLWALRGGFNNITDRQNPNVVNNVAGSPNFLAFYGGTSRALNFRIRWLGKI
jgi:outer membrane receptor protein involved in Fe transport